MAAVVTNSKEDFEQTRHITARKGTSKGSVMNNKTHSIILAAAALAVSGVNSKAALRCFNRMIDASLTADILELTRWMESPFFQEMLDPDDAMVFSGMAQVLIQHIASSMIKTADDFPSLAYWSSHIENLNLINELAPLPYWGAPPEVALRHRAALVSWDQTRGKALLLRQGAALRVRSYEALERAKREEHEKSDAILKSTRAIRDLNAMAHQKTALWTGDRFESLIIPRLESVEYARARYEEDLEQVHDWCSTSEYIGGEVHHWLMSLRTVDGLCLYEDFDGDMWCFATIEAELVR